MFERNCKICGKPLYSLRCRSSHGIPFPGIWTKDGFQPLTSYQPLTIVAPDLIKEETSTEVWEQVKPLLKKKCEYCGKSEDCDCYGYLV